MKMENKNRKKLGNILGIIAGIIWFFLGLSQHFLENYANILMVLIGIALIIINIMLLKGNASY